MFATRPRFTATGEKEGRRHKKHERNKTKKKREELEATCAYTESKCLGLLQ
jgi:hypothetical protein